MCEEHQLLACTGHDLMRQQKIGRGRKDRKSENPEPEKTPRILNTAVFFFFVGVGTQVAGDLVLHLSGICLRIYHPQPCRAFHPVLSQESDLEDSASEFHPSDCQADTDSDDECTLDTHDDPPSPDLLAKPKRRKPGPPMRFVDDSPRPFTDSPRPVTKDSAAGDAEAASRTSGMIGGARRSFHPGVGGSSSRGGGRASHHRPRQAVARTQQSAPSSGASRPPSSAASTTARPATTVQRPTSGDTDGPGHRGEGGPSRRASDPGKSAAAGGLSSQGRGSFTSSRGRAIGYAYREGAAPATAGGTAVSSSAPPSFTRIGGGSSHTPAGGGGRVSSVAITSDMSGESVYQALVAVGISLLSKAALLGILMSAVAPSHEESRQQVVSVFVDFFLFFFIHAPLILARHSCCSSRVRVSRPDFLWYSRPVSSLCH